MRRRRLAVRVLLATAVGVAGLVATAAPAAAHGVGGLEPTNYETRVVRMVPPVAGVTVEAVDLGEALRLTNDSDRDVVVLGYEQEPYLRVGPRGVFVNARSPARYINRTLRGTTKVPKSADPEAAPRWIRTGDGPSVTWHDHRAHWMGNDDPPAVQDDPGSPHLVQPFRVVLRTGGEKVTVFGDVRWVPPPSPWPWLAGAAAFAVALVVLAARRKVAVAYAIGLVTLLVAQVLHVVGLWGGSTDSIGSRLGASAYSLAGMALTVLALVMLARRGPRSATPLVLLAGLFLALAGGLADVTTLSRSQVPSTIPAWIDRLTIAATLGAGLGLTIAAGLQLRRERREGMVAVPPPAPSSVAPVP